MERGRKKEERKKYTLLFSLQHTHSQLSLTHYSHKTTCLSVHTLFAVTQDAYLLHAHILLVFHFLSPSQTTPPFVDKHTHIHTHHSGVTGVVSWRECVGDLGVITAWLSDSSDDDIQCFELLWSGPAPNTTRQYTLSASQPCIHVAQILLQHTFVVLYLMFSCRFRSWQKNKTKHGSLLLEGQMMCISLCLKVRYDFQGHLLYLTHTLHAHHCYVVYKCNLLLNLLLLLKSLLSVCVVTASDCVQFTQVSVRLILPSLFCQAQGAAVCQIVAIK